MAKAALGAAQGEGEATLGPREHRLNGERITPEKVRGRTDEVNIGLKERRYPR